MPLGGQPYRCAETLYPEGPEGEWPGKYGHPTATRRGPRGPDYCCSIKPGDECRR